MSRVIAQVLERYSTDKEYDLHKSHEKNQFHTLRYDFKPASINSDESASLELTSRGEVTIKAPNISGSASSHTVFKGQRRPHVKECLLVIDNRTGEMVLQKLTDNITVKATRTLGNGAAPSSAAGVSSSANSVPQTGPPINNAAASKPPKNVANNSQQSSSGQSKINNSNSNNNNSGKTGNTTDGPQLSEESSSSSDDDDDDSSDSDSSSSSSSSDSDSSSQSNDEGFTF